MNKQIRKLSQSFRFALRGIRRCIQTERNFRIHLCTALYVAVFALIGQLDGTRCAILCLCFAMMIGAELMNTAIERLCDRDARGYDGAVRDAKDIAAAAVFICALFCAIVGALFFINCTVIDNLYDFLKSRLWVAGVITLTIPVSIAFIFDLRGRL